VAVTARSQPVTNRSPRLSMRAGRRAQSPVLGIGRSARAPDPRRPAEHRFVTTVAVTRAIHVAAPRSISGRVRYVDQSAGSGA
jgi:hypothetical protein